MAIHIATLAKAPYLWIRRAVADTLFERRYDVRTSPVIELDELGIPAHERIRYQATGWLNLPRILPAREVGPHDVFVDFGSGMGRVVLQAATRYPCKKVIGVELSGRLVGIARANVARNAHRLRCAEVSFVESDALDYEIPDDMTIAFFHNPFTGSIFARVLQRIVESVDRAPRTVRVVYVNPVEERALLETGRARVVRRLRGMRPTAEWSRSNSTRMYEITPRAIGHGVAG
ncbi:class I SAM-dependent methyltransferase [Saccharopolyspora rosea]|uniref:Class I SAM-dependent methyltransferase n=1 Tax=Saccharopolyspora rosea TaxID=524884 RepID=A0ABW3FQT6_9PSEU|nr:class I SAM-dependent methyltransferase [Saccharopolyspora rosea]